MEFSENGRVRNEPSRHCCEMMTSNLDWECQLHQDPYDCPDALVIFIAKFAEYGLIIHDGGTSFVAIDFCPWCGASLPESQRNRWVDELEAMGFDTVSCDDLPEEYRDGRWLMPPATA
ncbi:DUF6980 family protein [Nocardia sp. NBC_00416]|uniref:DUF6980 family protein n=1 Tax=Nocardia sp. NBC_00416 TaxID=2975991 RepID=UPI002E233074